MTNKKVGEAMNYDVNDAKTLDPFEIAEEEFDMFMSNWFEVIECGMKNVTEGIGETYTEWEAGYPVFISAQTGRGKNYFIENTLLPYVKNLYWSDGEPCRVLLLSNRIALSLQTKKRLLKSLGMESEMKLYSDEGILSKHDFGFVTILNYQSLLGKPDFLKGKYSHVICDEAHFFTSDAMFNPTTEIILSAIVNNFSDAIRVYMTATFEESLYHIHNKEKPPEKKKFKSNKEHIEHFIGKYTCYKFDNDYTYLDFQYYSEFDELINIIAGSSEKWIIFVDNKKWCKEFKEKLLEANSELDGEVSVISAESKKDEEYQQILADAKFQGRILLSTSVIDNGVNFHDEQLKNVVISEVDKTKLLQLLGRVRVKEGERITLYIKKHNEPHLSYLTDHLCSQYAAYISCINASYEIGYPPFIKLNKDALEARKDFIYKYYNGNINGFQNAKKWFYRDSSLPECVHFNKIAYCLLPKLSERYNFVLSEIQNTGDGSEHLKRQLGWFSRTYDETYDITAMGVSKAKADFDIYLDTLIGKRIPKEERGEFKVGFFKKYVFAYGLRTKKDGFKGEDHKTRTKSYGIKIITEIFKVRNIDLVMVTDKKEGSWYISKKGL